MTTEPARGRKRERGLFWFSVLVLCVTVALGLNALLSHGFSARDRPWPVEAAIARHLRRLALPSGVAETRNPLASSALALAEGRDHFADHCAVCHANNGSGKTPINAGLYPPAPDLRTRVTQDLRDGEILWIIRNGVRFTGMPGWGGTDEENWKLVQFIRHLPKLTDEELGFMKDVNGQHDESEHR